MQKIFRALILALSLALSTLASAIAPLTNSKLKGLTMCHCPQSIGVAPDTCAIECSESATTAIGYWNYSKNSFLLFDFLKISNPERAGSGEAAERGALKNEQSYLAEINTKQLTEELGRAADEAARRAREAFETGTQEIADDILGILRQKTDWSPEKRAAFVDWRINQTLENGGLQQGSDRYKRWFSGAKAKIEGKY